MMKLLDVQLANTAIGLYLDNFLQFISVKNLNGFENALRATAKARKIR